MKKLLAIFILLLPFNVFAISASSAIVMDLDTGRVLYGYNIDEEKLIASTTKIMTAIIAIEKGNLEEEIEITDIIYEAYGSAIYIEVGEKLSLKDLLYGLMLRSGNDAALVISKYIAGSEDEFVYLMNEYADNLNMNKTIFYNPHGLEESNGNANKSTALDMAKLTKYAMQNSKFREIFKTKSYTVKTNFKTYVWHNKNKLLNLDYVNGGKTGFTELARRTLVTTGSKDNMNIVIVTLNDPDDWVDHKKLYEEVFKNYRSYEILNKDKFNIDSNRLYYKEDFLFIKNNFNMMLSEGELKNIKLNINLMKLKEYSNDTKVGFVEVKLKDTIIHKEPIYVIKNEENKMNWWQKFRGWLFKW